MSAKMRASSARINSDKACARLNERNALNSQLKVATSSVSNATTRAILNVRNTPENETQNEASSKNRIMVKKDGNLKARKKGSVLNSPKCSKRTNRISDKHSLDIKSINTDRENDKEIESVISNDILTVNKKETDSNLLEESESVGKLDESNDTVDISEAFESINGDMHNENTSTGIYNIANTAENASCDLETVCAYTSEGNDETSVDHDTSRCTKNASDHSIIIHVNKVPRPVQIQQRFPLRSKLKKPTSKTNYISDMKIHSNIPKTKYVTQINANLSESLTGTISTAKTPAARGGKQCQSKLPSSQSKLPAPSSKTEESNTIEVKLNKTVSIQSDSSTTLRPDYPEGSDTIYSEEHSENIVPKAESVIHKTCTITQVRQCSKNSDFRKTPDECVNGYLSESNTDAKTISAGHSVLSNPSSSASSLTIRATDDDSAADSDKTKCLKQAGANAKQDVVKRKISSQESKLRTHFGKTSTTQTQLRATIKHSTSSKSDRIGVMNSNNTTLKSRQRSVTHDEKSDDNQERNKKSISLVSQSNGKSRLFAEGKYNQCSEKQIEVKFMSGDSNKNENRSFTKAAAISCPTSDRKAKSQTLTQARFPKPKLVNGKKVEPVSKFTDLNRSCSSTSSRDSNSSSKSRSNSRSRSSTPSSIVGTTKHVVDTGDRKRSLVEWKSKSSSRDSSSRSRSSTPSVTSSMSDDNKQEGNTNKRVKQNAVGKRPVSKLKIPLRSSVPTCSIKDKNNSDINVKSKFKSEVQRNVNTENGAPKSLQSPTSAKKIIKSSENKTSVMTRNSTISKCSNTQNSNSRSRSTTPEEVAAHASIALKKRSRVVISQIPNIQSNSKINARPGKIAKAFSAVATSQNGQLKNVDENKSRESTSRSRSTTPGSATSSDGAKSSSSSVTNKTRRITNNNIHTDKTCISRQNENIKQQGSIPNKRMIKATSGIPARTNKHSPDIKDNKARKLATYQDGVSNSSERNETITTTPTNSASTRTKSKLPLTASTSQNTSRSIPKLQKRPQIQKSQNVQSQITHRLSPTDRNKPTAKSTDLSMQPSSSIKLAKITISTENKRSKNEPTTLKMRTTARPEDLKSDQKRNKAFVSGNKCGLITSLSLIKKDNVSSCLDNKSDKQSSLVKRGRKSEIEHTNLSRGSAAINCDGTDSVLNHIEHSIHGENQQGIVSCSEQTVSKGNKTNEYSREASLDNCDTEMQNTCTDIQVDCACVETEIVDKKDSENRNKNESKIKYQHDANLIRRENSDATDKQMESVEIHHRNSSKSKSAVIGDPSFEVNINCLSRNQLNRYSSEHEETWLELNREESTGLKKDGIVDEKLRDLCQESMSKFHSEIESLCAKNNAFYRNIKDNSITKLKSSAEMFNSENKYSTEDVCVEIISDKNQSSKIDNQDGKTVILVRNNSLNSNDEHGTEVNNYAGDLIDKPLLSSGNATSVPSHACKCQDDKKSEISTFEIDMYDINSSQKMPIIDVCSLKPTESSDFSYDKASNIVAATPSGAFGIQHTNKRQDKKITSDSTCVLCNDSSPCIHMDVNQQNIASVCVTVCQTCEPKVVSEIASDSVNEFNQEQLEYLDKISENITMDESHLMKITDGNTVPSSELGNITECNGAVINLGLIKEDISLSDLSNLKTDEQRCDVVADNSGVLDINDDDAIDEQQLVHDDFNTKMLPKRENYSQSCVTKITSNIEDWQETFLCDKKSPENNTDVELQVPNNSEINKATSCHKSECTSLCLCSNEDKTHDLSANMDKTRVDIIACDFTSDDMDKVFVTGSGYTKESKDMCASGISAVQYMGVSEGLEHANSVSYSDSQIVEIALKNDPDLVTVSPVLDTTANRKKNEKTEDIIHLTECDSLEQQDANHYNDEWTSRSYCSHEEDVKLSSGGYDGSFQGSLSSVYFMQNTGKSGQTCERNICDSNESSNDLLSAKCANESESRAENLDDNSCLSDIAMPVGDNVNQPGIIEQKVTEQTLEQHISYNSQNAALMDSGLQQVFGICNDDDKGVQAKLVCDIIDEIATANTETISLGSIHEISTITTSLNPEIMCEQHERDHTTLEISKSVQISRDNDIISENLTNNEVHDTNGIMPSYLLPQTESAQFQPDVSLTNSNNIDETTAVCEIREKHPKCFDNTNDSDDIFSQQVINNGICEIECATGIENKTTDTWAEFECSEHDNILTPMLPGEINKNYLSSIKDSKYSENLLEPTHDDSQRDITNESCVYQPIETTASSSDMSEQKAVCSDSCHQRNTSLEFQIVSDGSPEFQTGSQISSEMQIVNERNIEFQRVSDSHSDSQAVSERMSNFETLPCSENISDNLPHEFGKTFYSSAAIEQIRQCSILSGQSILSDSDSRNVRDLNISASQTEDLDLTNGLSTNGQSVIGDDLSSSSSREHQNDADDREFQNNANVLLHQNLIDLNTSQIVDHSNISETSDLNSCAPYSTQNKLFNEQFDDSTSAFDGNTCAEINYSLNNASLFAVKTPKDTESSKQEFSEQNKNSECYDLNLVDGLHDNTSNELSIVDQTSIDPNLSNVELNALSEDNQSTNIELSKEIDINESELNINQVCATTEDGLSDICDTFVDAEDSDKNEHEPELNDIDSKENRLSLISVNTSTDSFVDAVESLDDEYLTSSVLRHSREIQNEDFLSQNPSDTYDVSSDISDSIDDMSGWEEFTEIIEDIGDINSSEMELDPHKMTSTGNKFSKRPSELQHCNSVSRIRSVLQDKYYQINTPTKRETITSSVNETKKISYGVKRYETDRADISGSIFKTGNVCVSGEVKSQSVRVEAKHDSCTKYTDDDDNGFDRCSDSQCRHSQIPGDAASTGQQLLHLKGPSCHSTNGHLQNSDSSVGSRIETALMKRTERRRRRHVDQQYKSANLGNSNDVNSDINATEIIVHTSLNSKDNVEDSICIENVTCTHSTNSATSLGVSDNMTFNNKTVSGNESLSSQNNTGIELNIMHINTNLNTDKHEQDSGHNAILREACNVQSSGVDNNESSILFTITAETVDKTNVAECPVEQSSRESPNSVIQTWCTPSENMDIQRVELNIYSKSEVTDENKLVPDTLNGTPELDDIEFIDADDDSETSSKQSSEVSSVVNNDLLSNQPLIPTVCVTISLDNNVGDPEIGDGNHSEDDEDVEVDNTMISLDKKEADGELKVEEKHDKPSNETSIFVDDSSDKDDINIEYPNECDKLHANNYNTSNEAYEHSNISPSIESSAEVPMLEQSCINAHMIHATLYENNGAIVLESTNDDSSSTLPDSNDTNTEIVEESNISVKHALELERLKLSDSNDVRSRKALFDSKRSGRRATIETSSIELKVESSTSDNEEQKTKVAKPVKKSKSFRYEKKVMSPISRDDKTAEAERAVSPVSQKVSDICKSFMTKTRSSVQRTRDESTSKSPAPQRKLMKWVNDHGKWLRIPVDDITDSQRYEVFSPDNDDVENKFDLDVDSKHETQLTKPVEDILKRNDTLLVKSQPPPVPQKSVGNRSSSHSKELLNPLARMESQLESSSKLSMPFKETSSIPVTEQSYKDKNSKFADTKRESDDVLSVPISPSIIIQPNYSVTNLKCAVNDKTNNGITAKTISQEVDEYKRAKQNVVHTNSGKEITAIEAVDVKVNDDESQTKSECFKAKESEEKCSHEVKVIGTTLEDAACDQDTHMKRQELLFGLLDSYNRRKPRKISHDEIGRRCASPIGMRTGYVVNKDQEEKVIKADEEPATEKAICIPKIKAIKIQEEVFECKSEYIKDNNLKLNYEIRSDIGAQKAKLLRKSKTFSGMADFERKYEPQTYDSFRQHESNLSREHLASSVDMINKQIDRHNSYSNAATVTSKMMDKRARAGLKLQIDKAKYRSRNTDGENSPNCLNTNQTNSRSQGDRSPNRLAVNQPMVRMRSPDKGPRIQRSKLLSEIVEVEENKDDISVTCDRQQQQRHLKDRNKVEVQRAVKGSNKRRSLSLPTGTLAFGEARVVFKNGHFTIETMDGMQIDSSRPALYQTNVRMSESHLDDNWGMPDTGRDEFSNSSVKSNSREITVSDHNKRPMRRQHGKAVLQSYDSSEDVFYSESEILESVQGYKGGLEGESCAFGMGRTSDDVFNESSSSRASDMSVDSYYSDRTDISLNSDIASDSKKLSSSSLPEQKDEDVKRVMQRAKRTSSFRAAQEAGASRLSGIHEDKVHETGRSRSVSVDESQSPDLNILPKTQTSQSQNPTFLKKVMAKRKSLNENLNISAFAKQSETAKEFFSKKMTLKGLFRKNKSDSSVGSSSPLRMDHPSSPPLATFQDDDIASVDTPPSSPYHGNREFRGRRHTSADIYRKSFQPDSSETDSNCPTPTLERSGLSHLSVSSPSTPSHKSGSFTNLTSQTSSHDDVISIASVSSISSSSVHSPPSEQPNKPKTPKPVGASPRRNPSFGSQLSRTGSMSSQRNVMNSVTSLDGENYEPFTDDAIRDPRCECGNKDVCLKHRSSNSATSRGSSDSLNTLCRFCKQMDYYYKNDNLEQKQLQSKEKLAEDLTAGFKKDSPARTNLERLGIIVQQADVASSNSNDSGIQRDASVHSSNESIKGVPDGHVRLRRNKSLSPHQDRPKSEIAVRWADGNSGDYDLVESPIKLRHREQTTRDRPRPKSDLEGSSFLSDRMKAFGSEINLQPYCSLRNLYDTRRRDVDKQKNRRMSTPHPIKTRLQTTRPQKLQKQPPLVRSSSMPESLEKIHKRRKMHHLLDFHLDSLSRHMDLDDCMSDGSDLSFDQASLQERSVSIQSSNSQLTSMDEDEDNLTYAEALWDHITLDPEEIGFCAQDVIHVLDMDDKDWWYGVIDDREGWFPANFVRLRVNQDEIDDDDLDLDVTIQNTLTSSPKLRRISMLNKNQARSNVVNEIINAEREYVKHLKDVVEGYIQHARKRTEMFPEERIRLIFGNIETIYSFAQKFLSQLEMCIDVCPHLSEIGQCFLDNDHGFEIYSDYCNNHPSACEELDDVCKNSKYKHFFEACRLLQELVEIPLEGFLLTPVQKICKYPLQLAELLKYTPPDHADYVRVRDALAAMRKIATLINERKRKMESIEKIAVWQHSVVDWEGPELLDRSSELIFSGELNKINSAGWSQERFFFLFDHQLVYCKKELLKRHVFNYKGRIDLDNCEIIDIPDGKDTQYNVTVKHGWKLHEIHKDKWYLVYAKTEAVKQHWLKSIKNERKRVLEDQENDFCVPDHWKQTVLNKVRSQSNLKDKQSAGRFSQGQLMLQRDCKDFTYSTLPRLRASQKHDTKKKGWFKFGTGKKSKR